MSFSDPEYNIAQLMIPEGARVADLGTGSGAYAIAAARIVGPTGEVLAIEVQKELLSRLKSAAKTEGLHNLEVIWGDLERLGGTKIRDFSIDVALVSNVLFQIEDRRGFITELKRIMKQNGKVLVVEWSDSYSGLGPRPEEIIPRSDVQTLLEKHHFVLEREIDAGDHHYGLIFRNTIH